MEATAISHVQACFEAQQAFFQTGATRPADARKKQMKILREALRNYEARLLKALNQDMGKPETEAFLLDFAFTYQELDHAIKHLEGWMQPRRVSSHLLQTPAAAFIQPEPYGVTAVIAPWNFPVYLLLLPAVGAIAAGNTVILKPSEHVPHTSSVLSAMMKEYFDPQWVALIEGGIPETQELLAQPLDYIFFTGGTAVGKIVMRAAAEHLTPVTLELGGKSPTIIDESAPLEASLRRIVWGKFMNSGQTCIAPDYLLIPQHLKAEAIDIIHNLLDEFYGENPKLSPDFARVINERHFDRLSRLMVGNIVIGGDSDRETNYISPTVIDVDDPAEHPAMQEEIFGPILPVIGYEEMADAIEFVNARPKPLVAYLFSNSRRHHNMLIERTSSGGVCINDTILHWSLADLPVGGVGPSGMGRAHGKSTFDTFSHHKSVMKRSLLIDATPFVRFPPYRTALSLIRDLVKWFA